MPTTVVKTIAATSSPITPDYTSLAAWFAACPVNLVIVDQIWQGECLDQGEFTGAVSLLVIVGTIVDSTRYIILKCATGASFSDKAGVRTTALDYNASTGVAIRSTSNYIKTISTSVKTVFIGLQIAGQVINDTTLLTEGEETTTINCIIKNTGSSSSFVAGSSNNTYSIFFYNCLIIYTGTGGGFCIYGRSSPSGARCIGCTSIKLGTAVGVNYVLDNYGTVLIEDCAGFGASSFKSGNATGATGSGFNATDQATAFGSNNQTSLTFANQFVSTTTDFRAVSTGSLYLNGTPDSNILTDISNTIRSLTTPTIGCWEVTATPSGFLAHAPILYLQAIRQSNFF